MSIFPKILRDRDSALIVYVNVFCIGKDPPNLFVRFNFAKKSASVLMVGTATTLIGKEAKSNTIDKSKLKGLYGFYLALSYRLEGKVDK